VEVAVESVSRVIFHLLTVFGLQLRSDEERDDDEEEVVVVDGQQRLQRKRRSMRRLSDRPAAPI